MTQVGDHYLRDGASLCAHCEQAWPCLGYVRELELEVEHLWRVLEDV